MYKLRRKLFSQNFLHSRKLISRLIRSSSIGKNDLVLEIGPGKGTITELLLYQARYVLAVEIDSHWCSYLQEKFNHVDTLTLYQDDILHFRLPTVPYKVFGNIPFSIEGKIIRKLIDAKNPPEDCYLVVMKELACRLSAPYKENLFSLIHKPWFEFSISHRFQRTDFTPIPSVDAVIMRFAKRKEPLLPWRQRTQYQRFVAAGFGQGLPVVKNLQGVYGNSFTTRIFQKLHIDKRAKPGTLSLHQWISLYRSFVSPLSESTI